MGDAIVPGIYRHYRGEQYEYEVLGVALHSETQEPLVVYRTRYETSEVPMGSLFVRPLEMFSELVEVRGERVPRFQIVRPSS